MSLRNLLVAKCVIWAFKWAKYLHRNFYTCILSSHAYVLVGIIYICIYIYLYIYNCIMANITAPPRDAARSWCSGLGCDSRSIYYIMWAGIRSINSVYSCDNLIKPTLCSEPLYTMMCVEVLPGWCQDILVISVKPDLCLYGIIKLAKFWSLHFCCDISGVTIHT